MAISINIPAFSPAISLLLLAYTNRFLVIAQIIRELHKKYLEHADKVLLLIKLKIYEED